jgi:hypothetical protein
MQGGERSCGCWVGLRFSVPSRQSRGGSFVHSTEYRGFENKQNVIWFGMGCMSLYTAGGSDEYCISLMSMSRFLGADLNVTF